MLNDQSMKRVEKLFTGMEQLVSRPNGNGEKDDSATTMPSGEAAQFSTPASLLQEVEALRSRVLELEARLNEKDMKVHSAPILYEKEEVGFAYVEEKIMPIRGPRQTAQ